MSAARLLATHVPSAPEAAVLVLHGGAARRDGTAVSPTQLSVLRMVPTAARVAAAGRRRLAVFRVLNSARGWDSGHTPVDDASWAMDAVAERLGRDVPTCLVGHSLGGRAALLSAARPTVRSVVALAPWVYDSDGVDAPGRAVLVVHGDEDRVASPERSARVAERMGRTAEVGYVTVRGGSHAMLRRGATFDRLAADFAVATLLGRQARGAVARVLAGESPLTV